MISAAANLEEKLSPANAEGVYFPIILMIELHPFLEVPIGSLA
jgi:hypothetical protein